MCLGCGRESHDDGNSGLVSARTYSVGPWETSACAKTIEQLGGDPARYPASVVVTDDKTCLRVWREDRAKYMECKVGRRPCLVKVPKPALEQSRGVDALIHAIPDSLVGTDGRIYAWFRQRGTPSDFIRSQRVFDVENALIDSRGWAYCHGSQPSPVEMHPGHGVFVGLYSDISRELRTGLRGWPEFLVSWQDSVVIGTSHGTYGIYRYNDDAGWTVVLEAEARGPSGAIIDVLDFDPATGALLLFRTTSKFFGVVAGRPYVCPVSDSRSMRRVEWTPGGMIRFVNPLALKGLHDG
jgi:hypothetical protein